LVTPQAVFAQILASAEDIGVDAVKIGMLGSPETIDAVAVGLTYIGVQHAPVVIDPVMVAESGAVLLDDETRKALVDVLIPVCTVVTPNIPEARVLTGLGEEASQEELARGVLALGPQALGQHAPGPQAVVVTGGHSEDLIDLFFDG
jgi:hydroxymethylpyrimidine/phosphomethylpyrimidine kinase